MHTRSDTYTNRLIEYLKTKPEGRYSPFDIRMDLGISSHSWRWFSNRHVYPEGSRVRAKLSEIGVDIETILKWSQPNSRMYPASIFVVKQPSNGS
ncbi:hypothetical protein ROTO_37170 [Roseovarius tolerans]|uniref:Uncharacterized protein n=1 Tax=Roseovarius tolerans TaxID=74031 RepID=A0A0L6CQC0_9RHOB|nr:hypothetical protein ROTO_37170 [Roseovarius tolerans]